MGEGDEESKSRVEIQEKGDIFFFYRPKVDREEAHGVQDIQRFYLVLRPDPNSGGSELEQQHLLRLILMGRKSLPDPTKKSTPYWGFVEMVTTSIHQLKAALKGEEYDTATRGHRHLPDCRAVGEGVYRILRHHPAGSSKMHTHLVYKLEFPAPGKEEEPQEALNIAREASFLIQIKNPDQHAGSSQFRGLNNKRKAAFPAQLQGLFGHLRRYNPADPPDFLNFEGCEFLLISASDDIEQELGLELKTEQPQDDTECSDLIKTFGETAASTRPLFQGTWD